MNDRALDLDEILDTMELSTSKFSALDESGVRVAWFDDFGNLFLKGTLEENSDFSPATGHDEFKFKDSSDDLVMVIDTTNGNMYIAGSLYDEQTGTLTPSAMDDNFVIKDSSGAVVAYIDDSGDLYLKGKQN